MSAETSGSLFFSTFAGSIANSTLGPSTGEQQDRIIVQNGGALLKLLAVKTKVITHLLYFL